MPANGMNLFAVWIPDPSVTTTTTPTTTTTTPSNGGVSTTTTTTTTPINSGVTTSTQPAASSPGASGDVTPPVAAPALQNPSASQTANGAASKPVTNPVTKQENAVPATAPAVVEEDTSAQDDTSTVPDLESVGRNEAGATIGGRSVSSQISYNNGNVVVSVAGATLEYTIIDSAGTQRILSGTAPVIVEPGDTVGVRFAKFEDNAEASAWIVPGDLPLGSTKLTGGEGTINGIISEEVTAGIRRIITVTETENNEPFVVALGVEVIDSVDSDTSWSLVFLIIVGLAVAGALLIPAARRRRDNER